MRTIYGSAWWSRGISPRIPSGRSGFDSRREREHFSLKKKTVFNIVRSLNLLQCHWEIYKAAFDPCINDQGRLHCGFAFIQLSRKRLINYFFIAICKWREEEEDRCAIGGSKLPNKLYLLLNDVESNIVLECFFFFFLICSPQLWTHTHICLSR